MASGASSRRLPAVFAVVIARIHSYASATLVKQLRVRSQVASALRCPGQLLLLLSSVMTRLRFAKAPLLVRFGLADTKQKRKLGVSAGG